MKKLITLFIIILILITAISVGAAPLRQTDAGGEMYVVQANDWLSKLAEKFYGDVLAYPVIVEATNAKAAQDTTFTVIQNPDVIEIGQKLWIPTAAVITATAVLPAQPETTPVSPTRALQLPPGTAAVTATQVIRYLPAVPTATQSGSCWTSSIAAPGSPYAWRCTVDNSIYDPCLTAADGKTIVCGVPDQEFALTLTEPLPAPDAVNLPPKPWQFTLPGGVVCGPFTGTLPPLEEMSYYGCSDQAIILGDLQEGTTWLAEKGFPAPQADGSFPMQVTNREVVPVLKVWLAGDPTAK